MGITLEQPLPFLELSHLRRSVHLLIKAVNKDTRQGSIKRQFAECLIDLQGLSLSRSAFPRISFCPNQLASQLVATELLDSERQDESRRFSRPEQTSYHRQLLEALRYLTANMPQAALAFRLMVTDIVCAKSTTSRGGTAGGSLGIIFVDPTTLSGVHETAEILLHELTHLCLYFEDMLFRIFESVDFSDESNLSLSAVLQTPRPYDLAFRSACVALELMYFRSKLDLEWRNLSAGAGTCFLDLKRRAEICLSPTGLLLLESLRLSFEAYAA